MYKLADKDKGYLKLGDDRGSEHDLSSHKSLLDKAYKKVSSDIAKLDSISDSGLLDKLAGEYGIGERELGDSFSGWKNW